MGVLRVPFAWIVNLGFRFLHVVYQRPQPGNCAEQLHGNELRTPVKEEKTYLAKEIQPTSDELCGASSAADQHLNEPSDNGFNPFPIIIACIGFDGLKE